MQQPSPGNQGQQYMFHDGMLQQRTRSLLGQRCTL